jgi:eukaryotic-like serine/threonine-protein kinase
MPKGLEAQAGVTEGEILAGKYRVEKVLGVGGMGVVVAARHIDLDEKVAIKFLLPTMLTDGAAVARFQREAKAAVRIKSEHVARVFDVGRLPNGAPYMVMEFLEGSDLAALLAQHGAMPLAQAVDFILQACVAVADAHALGIIHRDLKPANLFCIRRSDGQLSIKVLDFGISKLAEADGSGMSFTQTNAMMGSPLYMSPEQFRSSKNVDARTDIWALGAILFELVTGQTPFTAGSVPELAVRIATERAPSATQVNPQVPPALAAIIARCLEREQEQRPRNVANLAVALAPFALPTGRALVDRVVGISGQPASGAGPSLRSSQAPASFEPPYSGTGQPGAPGTTDNRTAPAVQWTSPGPPSLRRRVLPAIGLVGGLAVAGIAWWATQRPADTAAIESAATATTAPPAAGAEATTPPPAPSPTPSIKPPEVAPLAASASAGVREELEPAPPRKGLPVRAPKGKRPAATAAARPEPPPPTPTPAPKPTPTAASPNTPRVSCDPPFFFDSKGNRVFKQECL